MLFKVNKTKKVKVDRLRAECRVRYWEDAEVNGAEDGSLMLPLVPLRFGDYWVPTIMLDTGRILEWPEGVTASLHYKVCDDGTYTLLSASGDAVASIDGYVPKIMCPGGDGYGDYVIMKIGPDGVIENWHADLSPWEQTRAKT